MPARAGDRLPTCASRGRRPTAAARPRSSIQPAISATTDERPGGDDARGRTSVELGSRRGRTRTDEVDDAEQREQRADPDHRLEGEADDVHRRAVAGRDGVETLHRSRSGRGTRAARAASGSGCRTRPRRPRTSRACASARPSSSCASPSNAASLTGWFVGDVAAVPVADEDLHRRGERRDRQRDRERGALVAAPAPAQPRERVRARRRGSR